MKRWHVVVALIMIGCVLYAPNLHNPLFWDDADWITNNPAAHTLSWSNVSFWFTHDVLAGIGGTSNYYRPILLFSFALDWVVGGDHPLGYHIMSNGLHITNAVLLFLLLDLLLASTRLRYQRTIAAVAALLWLIHPVHPEAVAYISGRGDPLSVCLMLVSALVFLQKGKSFLGRVASLVLALLAILSRETAVLFPAYLSLILITFVHAKEQFWKSLRKALVDVWPFIALSSGYMALRLTVLNFAGTTNWYQYSTDYSSNVEVRIWTFLGALWEYFRVSLIPVGLHMEHSVPVLRDPWHWSVLGGLSLLIFAVWQVRRAWLRGRRLWFFGVGMFLAPFLMSSGILVPINAVFYEHWLYIPLIGLAVLLSIYAVQYIAIWYEHRRWLAIIAAVVLLSYSIFLGIQTVKRNIVWGNTEQFYQEILSYEPGNVRVLNNLANLYANENKIVLAEPYWRQAIEADNTKPAPYFNLGNLMLDRGDTKASEQLYKQAITVDPAFHYAYRNLAVLYFRQGRYVEALDALIVLHKLLPTDEQVASTLRSLQQQLSPTR